MIASNGFTYFVDVQWKEIACRFEESVDDLRRQWDEQLARILEMLELGECWVDFLGTLPRVAQSIRAEGGVPRDDRRGPLLASSTCGLRRGRYRAAPSPSFLGSSDEA